jgi:hypothetical protein
LANFDVDGEAGTVVAMASRRHGKNEKTRGDWACVCRKKIVRVSLWVPMLGITMASPRGAATTGGLSAVSVVTGW